MRQITYKKNEYQEIYSSVYRYSIKYLEEKYCVFENICNFAENSHC